MTKPSETENLTRLDARTLECPMPLLKTKLALNGMSEGARLEVLATDPRSAKDLRLFLAKTSNDLICESEEDGVYTLVIEKGS